MGENVILAEHYFGDKDKEYVINNFDGAVIGTVEFNHTTNQLGMNEQDLVVAAYGIGNRLVIWTADRNSDKYSKYVHVINRNQTKNATSALGAPDRSRK